MTRETLLSVSDSSALINQGDEMQDELDYIVKSINMIYETFDALKEKWQGDKADESKAALEAAHEPLMTLCKQAQSKNDAIKNVGKILSDYRNKG
jgi:uncharacterized coiled-coil DUF342 family protein